MTTKIARIAPPPPAPSLRVELDEETAWAIRDALGSCALGSGNPLDEFWDTLSDALGDDRPRHIKIYRIVNRKDRQHPCVEVG
jgi:hypothetical protein